MHNLQPATASPHHHPGSQRRTLDLAIEVPSTELTSITSIAMWEEIYDKLAALAEQHRSTLVFVNTRKLVEKISFELSNRLGEDAVAAHHGSLSRTLRLDAEQRLKSGEIKILVATALARARHRHRHRRPRLPDRDHPRGSRSDAAASAGPATGAEPSPKAVSLPPLATTSSSRPRSSARW